MTFPDSKRKAPNVFFNVTDDTGAPTQTSFIAAETPIAANLAGTTVPGAPSAPGATLVINVPGAPSAPVATLIPDPTYSVDMDSLTMSLPSISDGELNVAVTYVTSAIYPHNVEENLTVGLPSIVDGRIFSLPPPVVESITIGLPSISAGALDTTIVYKTYTVNTDNLTMTIPSISAGALDTTIVYVVYNYQVENLILGVPSIVAGTLE